MSRATILGTTALAAFLAAPASFAITPEEVWQNWQAIGTTQGYGLVAGSQSRSGDTLVLSDVVMSMSDDEMTMSAPLGAISMRDRGDSSVEITLSPSYTISMSTTDGSNMQMAISVAQPGMVTVATGSPESISYQVTAPSVAIAVDTLNVDGEALPMSFAMSLESVAGTYLMEGGARGDLDVAMGADALVLSVSADNPQGDGSMRFDSRSQSPAIRFKGNAMPGMDTDDFGALLRAGLDIDGGYSLGATNYTFDFVDGDDTSASSGSFATGAFTLALNAARMAIGSSTTALDVTVSGSELPFPELNVKLGEFALSLLFPLEKADTPGDFSMVARIVDLVAPDMLWGMLDPMGALPRDPATVIIETKGKARVLADVTAPDAQFTGDAPAELHALDIDAVRVSAAGAELSGSGAFTFDNSDMETFAGFPRPTGALDLMLVGGNGLLDKLVAMGMVPNEQAMGARMMMGLFAKPGEGADTLTSRIEVMPDGAVMANGQRIQ